MKKRTFLKTSSLLAGGTLFSHLTGCNMEQKDKNLQNWAGNLTYSTGNVHYPKTIGGGAGNSKKMSQHNTAWFAALF